MTNRPTGNTRERALRRLEAAAPELHAEVLAGNLSAHAAMVRAGFRRPSFTVSASSPGRIADTLRKQLAPDMLAAVAQRLTGRASAEEGRDEPVV